MGTKKSDILLKYNLTNYTNFNAIKAFTEKSLAKQKQLRSGKFVDLESELNARIEESIGGNIAKDVAKNTYF
jgi:hypothetical protein